MNNREFKIGDKVTHKGRLDYGVGVVKGKDGYFYAVEFENPMSYFHSCDGMCKNGTGHWCAPSEMELVGEVNTTAEVKDMVNHPDHYNTGRVEVIDIIEDATKGLEGIQAVCLGNVLKYTLRFQHKNGLEDLKKAQWYLNKLIGVMENEAI